MHRFEAAHDMTALDNTTQHPQLLRLEGRLHRQVRTIPVGENSQPFEVLALAVDLLPGVFATMRAERGRIQFDADLAVLLLDLQFDRQTVAVPARRERRAIAVQAHGLEDHVLEHLVHGMADVNIAIRVRRAVDKAKYRAIAGLSLDPLVELFGFTGRNPGRLAFGQIGLHREIGLRQVQRVLVVLLVAHGVESVRASIETAARAAFRF